MIRTDSTKDALHLEHGKLWTIRCRGLCQLLFILARYSSCLLFFWEGSTQPNQGGGGDNALIWPVSTVMSCWPSLRVEMKLFWWPIKDQHSSSDSGRMWRVLICILTGLQERGAKRKQISFGGGDSYRRVRYHIVTWVQYFVLIHMIHTQNQYGYYCYG